MELTDSLQALFIDTAHSLKGSARRLLMARTGNELGPGGPRRAERALGWSRVTIRKDTPELESGCTCLAVCAARGRKPVEAPLPTLRHDMQALGDSQRQTDPQFRTTRLYTRLRAAAVRRQLIAQHGCADAVLPTVQPLTPKLNALGYSPTQVAKSQPPKNPRNRRALRAGHPSESPRCSGRRRLADLYGRQSYRHSRPLRPWGEESGPSGGGGPRFSAGGDGDARGHLAPDVACIVCVRHHLPSDQ